MKPGQSSCWTNERGATLVVVGLLLTVLVGFSALAIDIGYLYAARNELQNIADASALAAARKIGMTYQGMTQAEQESYEWDKDKIVALVNDVAQKNKAAGSAITIAADDVLIGHWAKIWSDNWQEFPKVENLSQPDAVHVIARRDSLANGNGPISTFFARVIGIDTVDVEAKATAALTGVGSMAPGELPLPVGISRFWFENLMANNGTFIGERIAFSPTTDPNACAGWNSYDYTPPSDNKIRKILEEDPKFPSPETIANQSSYNFIGGTLSTPTFDAMLDLFQKYGYDVDSSGNPILGADGKPLNDATGQGGIPLTDSDGVQLEYNDGTPRNFHHWPTQVVVYDWDDCSNPNTTIKIVGFAEFNMTDVLGPPSNLLAGVVLGPQVAEDNTRGGGGSYGLLSPFSGLVE